MLQGRVVYLLLLKLVATVPISPTESSDTVIEKGRYEPGVHTINNANPYQGVTVTEGHGKYPVIFEPLQNVQTSRSTYKVTSFIDFTPYLDYFQQFERYLEAFKTSIKAFENDPILQEFRELTMAATNERTGEACKHYPVCYTQSILYKLRIKIPRLYPIQKAPLAPRTRDILPEVVREGNQPTSSNFWIHGIQLIHPY